MGPVWTVPADEAKARLTCEGHEATGEWNGMLGRFICVCGWESGWHFDGYEYAADAAESHIVAMRERV